MSSNRKELIQRRQKGKLILSAWSKKMEKVCMNCITSDDFFSLEETAILRNSFFDKVRNARQSLYYSKNEFKKIIHQLNAVEKQLGSQSIILFHSKDKFIGALRIESHCVLNNTEELWAFVEEDFSVATMDLESGLCLEENYYDSEGNFIPDGLYELTIWGMTSE